jgi:hypothetical protein
MTVKEDDKREGGGSLVEGLELPVHTVPFVAAVPVESTTYTAIAQPVAPAATTTASATMTATTTSNVVVSPVATAQGNTAGRSPPANAPAGGQWVTCRRIGPTTWSIAVGVSVVTCLVSCCPCGLFALLCPCDTEDVYVVNGKAYDPRGTHLGASRNMRMQR